ncbi:hypothetical protein F5B18DRAFT_180045 [Nemania serpens]|nr:hypothetical protein F5B18DRAFT_180045 [Nemania serpens]
MHQSVNEFFKEKDPLRGIFGDMQTTLMPAYAAVTYLQFKDIPHSALLEKGSFFSILRPVLVGSHQLNRRCLQGRSLAQNDNIYHQPKYLPSQSLDRLRLKARSTSTILATLLSNLILGGWRNYYWT